MFVSHESSPRPWGCFPVPRPVHVERAVFPTSVGVFPDFDREEEEALGLPHVRGGVSIRIAVGKKWKESSPRPWGCFL